jgi:hypothetical protein
MYIPVLTEAVVIKGAHIVAAKWALLHNNPALTAAQTGARMANVIPGAVNPAYVPVLTHGATAAALGQGTAGAAAAPTASASAVHDAVKLVIPVVAWAAWQLLRKSEPSGEGKGVLPAR